MGLGQVDETSLTRVALVAEQEDVRPANDNPPLLPHLNKYLNIKNTVYIMYLYVV